MANTLGEKKDLPNVDQAGDWLESFARGILKTAEDTMKAHTGGRDGDLWLKFEILQIH